MEEQFRESLPIWKGSSMRDNITSDCFQGCFLFPEAEKTKRKMKMLSFPKGAKNLYYSHLSAEMPTPPL
jgi:hypothetical protein